MLSPYPLRGLIPLAQKRTNRKRTLALCATLLITQLHGLLLPLPVRAGDAPPVIIQEVAWAGSSLSTADEWIELANLRNATTTVGGWSLHGIGSNDRPIIFPEDALIPPFETYLIANYAEDHEKSALRGPVQVATSTVSISNSALIIELRDANGTTVDRTGDGGEPFAGSSASHTSMLRVSATSSGDLATSWTSTTSSAGFKPDIPDMGTPGFCDLCLTSYENIIEEETNGAEPDEYVTSTESAPEKTATSTESTIEEMATSTETLLEETATSTNNIMEQASTSTESESTKEAEEPTDNAGTHSSLPQQDDETVQETEPVVIHEQSVQFVSDSGPPVTLQLNEAVSNPISGPEWVELFIDDPAITQIDRDLELHDANGKVATIAQGMPVTAPQYLIVALSSAKLNNGGDDLTLREASGIVIDQTEIPKMYKGESWARDPADSVWKIADVLTPGAENLLPAIVAETEEAAKPVETAHTSLPQDTETLATENESAQLPSSANGGVNDPNAQSSNNKNIQPPDFTEQINQVFEAALVSNQSAENYMSKTKTTSKGKTLSSDLTPYPFEAMFDKSLHEARIRVTGIVASIPKLLGAAHNFILQNEDGRGLIVYVPKHLNIPPLGSTVQVGGTLSATYKGPELRMKKTDVWMTTATTTPPRPRIVDLLAPSTEDAWSLVNVEGTVIDVKSKSFVIETEDGIEVPVNVPYVVGYNTKRLKEEDRVRVTGLLNLRKDVPTLLPRTPEEIELLKHAEDTLALATEPANHFPDWVPFAAAGGAIALTGVSKRVRELIRKRKLQMLMKKAETIA